VVLLTGIALGLSMILVYVVYYFIMRRTLRHKITWMKGEVFPKTSLIIATYDEEATLPAKLKNVLELSYPKELLEIVIIDSGSKDRTVDIVEDFKKKHPEINTVFIRENERTGKTHALNIAYPKASGTVKIISDADALLERSALKNIVSNFNDKSVGAACGRQILLNPEENSSTRLEKGYRTIYNVLREGESLVDSTPIFHGELSAYRASLIEALPENKSADDSRMANIIRQKGFRSVYDTDSIFYENAPSSTQGRIIQKVRRGQGLIRVFWDFKNCMFRKKYGSYGMLILPAEFFIHCIFPIFWLLSIALFFTGLFFYSLSLFATSLALIGCIYLVSKLKTSSKWLGKIVDYATLLSCFSTSQLYLVYGLILWVTGRSLHKWQKVEDVRKKPVCLK
jgi:biofilm PGA synthesis N-glycosyltransferase PgaC